MADRVGKQVGSYRLIRLLGQGGFAEVYLGEHVYLNTYAAIKILSSQLTSQEAEQFRFEARTIARLEHPHIIRVLDFGVEERKPFLVMNYASNGTLREKHPKGQQLPLATVITYVRQIADALQHAHEEKVIHRDIKPENILLGRQGELLLSDFGIATLAHHTSSQNVQAVAGTIAYMAPEQILGYPKFASDQYSLGIVVYEWLCGERPFQGSFAEIAAKQAVQLPPLLREKISNISPEVEKVVLTALVKDPKQRFESVQAFATALEQASYIKSPSTVYPLNINYSMRAATSSMSPIIPALETPSSSSSASSLDAAQPVELYDQALPQVSMHSRIPVSPVKMVMPKSASTTTNSSQIPPHKALREPQHKVPSQIKVQTPSSFSLPRYSRRAVAVGLTTLGVGIGGGVIWKILTSNMSDQDLYQSTLKSKAGSSTPTTILPLKTTKSLFIYKIASGNPLSLAWSPDSKKVAFEGSKGVVQVREAITGKLISAYHGHSGSITSIAWSPDGIYIASGGGSYDQTVQISEAITGKHIFTYKGHSNATADSGGISSVVWSPDNTRIASAGGDMIMRVWSTTTGDDIFTYTDSFDGELYRIESVAWSHDGTHVAFGDAHSVVQIWDIITRKRSFIQKVTGNPLSVVAWSPNDKNIACANDDVQVLDISTGKAVITYNGHNKTGVLSMAWSPKGTHMVSGGYDGTVQIWDATSGKQLVVYMGHHQAVTSVAWSPNNALVASGSYDGTVQIWQVPSF